jgi:hypothetical protein
MMGEYINMGLMILILGATFWILRSPKKKKDPEHGGDQTPDTANEAKHESE